MYQLKKGRSDQIMGQLSEQERKILYEAVTNDGYVPDTLENSQTVERLVERRLLRLKSGNQRSQDKFVVTASGIVVLRAQYGEMGLIWNLKASDLPRYNSES
jgi:hypothetical protein